ncbi:hypothetical protein Y032_0283g1321 [Ancylostoma ceylanicum]|uniref:Uncharacterized protein n=1 Tax=Ancylostoma ceylanicum TaxID=53326 RepID=A0A016S7H5_9BILA|nr:hypothetical protein Y032_0283g1321 [Ancylostoma ceylanicum]
MVAGLLPFLQQEFGSAALEFGELRGKERSRVVLEVTDFVKSVLAHRHPCDSGNWRSVRVRFLLHNA